jgi:YfiH family protein
MMNLLDRSTLKIKNGIPYFEIPEIANMEWIHHGFLTRQGGVSLPPYDSLNVDDNALRKDGDRKGHVSQNKNLIAMTFGIHPNRLVLLDQIHQDQILLLRESFNTLPSSMEYDAIITNSSNTFLAILTADCLPIFVVDQKRKVIAAVHAGRQGTALHITTKVLKKMKKEFSCSPMDLLILLGPSIGPCCYEIDEKVFLFEWEPFSTPKGKGKWMVDLSQINIAQIEREGIEKEQIFRIDLCTRCHNDLFFSYRKESQTGRQLSFIGMK